MLNPSTQDKRYPPTRIEPSVDGSCESAYPAGDKQVNFGIHQAAEATQDGAGEVTGSSGGGQVTVTGTGFGLEPNVVVYRSFSEGTAGDPLQLAPPQGELGTVDSGSGAGMVYGEAFGRMCAYGYGNTGDNQIAIFHLPRLTREINIQLAMAIPAGRYYPGNTVTAPEQFPNDTGFKPAWLIYEWGANADGSKADLAFNGNSGGSLSTNGNTVNLTSGGGGFWGTGSEPAEHWDWDGFTSIQLIQQSDTVDPRNVSRTQTAFVTSAVTGASKPTGTTVKTWDVPGFQVTSGDSMTEAGAYWGAFYLNYGRTSDADPLATEIAYTDVYAAIPSSDDAEDYRQMAFIGDAPTLEGCTRRKPVIASSWTDTEVVIDFTGQPAEYTHAFVLRADGTYEVEAR